MVNNVIKFKCGDIIYNNEYNHYGVVLGSEYVPVFIASQNEEVVEEFVEYAWYRQDSGHFYNPRVPAKYVEHVKNDLPEDLKFLYDISDRLSHVRVDYVISGERWGTTIGYHKLLTQVLNSDHLLAVIERCVNAGVFAEDKIFFNEFEYSARRSFATYDNVEIGFYRV